MKIMEREDIVFYSNIASNVAISGVVCLFFYKLTEFIDSGTRMLDLAAESMEIVVDKIKTSKHDWFTSEKVEETQQQQNEETQQVEDSEDDETENEETEQVDENEESEVEETQTQQVTETIENQQSYEMMTEQEREQLRKLLNAAFIMSHDKVE